MTMATSKVHKVKFYNLHPKGINCMAVEKYNKKLAISRADATIQIWNLLHAPYIERTIPNKSNASIEALRWYKNRLFSTGIRGELIEYDLNTLLEKYVVHLTGGAGWCMDIHEQLSILVIGTEQGYLNLYQITDEGVEYVKILDKQEGRILCLTFDETGNYVASGSVDFVRIWNVESGHAIHKMSLSRVSVSTETVVWCIAILQDFQIVSGDSRGYITFWDGETGTQVESFQSHNGAVLSICEDKNTIYCAGVDPTIVSYDRIKIKSETSKWIRSNHRKIHDHDVRTLACLEKKLYSGGVDGYLACSYFPPKTLNKYPPLLQNPCVSLSRESKYILLRYQRSIEIWSLGQADQDNSKGVLKLKTEPINLLEIQTKGNEGISCASISNNGQMIVYSTGSRFRLFYFNYDNEKPELTSIANIPEECTPCIRAEFTSDNKYLIIAPNTGGLKVFKLSENQVFLFQSIETSKYMTDVITFLNISYCGKFLVCADPHSNIIVWNFKKNNWNFYCKFPRNECPPTAIGIHPNTNKLIVAYANHTFFEYSLKERKLTDFTSKSGNWLNRSYPIINITFDPQADYVIIMHDDSNFYVFNKNKISRTDSKEVQKKVPKLDTSAGLKVHPFKTIKTAKHLVYFDWIAKGEMVSVDVNPFALLEKLPPGCQKNKFGTK